MPAVAAVVSLDDVERSRRESVLAYCARLCDPDRIVDAVDAAFAGLHDQLEEADGHAALDLDRILLEETRNAAAERTDASAGLPGFAGLALRRSSACEVMPKLLAARASGLLGDADLERVDKHLSRCAACREMESRRREAERAYALLRAAPPTGSTEPFASPGDAAPEIDAGIAAVGQVPEAPEAASVEAPPSGNGNGPSIDDVPLGSTEETREHAVLPPEASEEPSAPDEPTTPALRDDITGEYAFELSDPEPLDLEAAEAEREPLGPEAAEAERDPLGAEPTEADAEPLAPAADAEPDNPAVAEPVAAASAPSDGESAPRGPRPTWMKWATVVGPLAVAAVAIGLIAALGSDDDDSKTGGTRGPNLTPQQQANAPQAPAPAPAPAPAERPSRTERRLDALGDRLLSPGMKGNDVKALQRLLGVPQTGTYDALTQYAVGEFQAQQDLPVDGQAGARTKRLLARRPRPPKNPPTLPSGGSTLPGDQTSPDGQSPSDGQTPTTPGSDAQTPGSGAAPTDPAQPPAAQQPPATGTTQPPAGQ